MVRTDRMQGSYGGQQQRFAWIVFIFVEIVFSSLAVYFLTFDRWGLWVWLMGTPSGASPTEWHSEWLADRHSVPFWESAAYDIWLGLLFCVMVLGCTRARHLASLDKRTQLTRLIVLPVLWIVLMSVLFNVGDTNDATHAGLAVLLLGALWLFPEVDLHKGRALSTVATELPGSEERG